MFVKPGVRHEDHVGVRAGPGSRNAAASGRPVPVPGAVPHPGRPGADDHPRAPRAGDAAGPLTDLGRFGLEAGLARPGHLREPAHQDQGRPECEPGSWPRTGPQPDHTPGYHGAPVSQAVWDPWPGNAR